MGFKEPREEVDDTFNGFADFTEEDLKIIEEDLKRADEAAEKRMRSTRNPFAPTKKKEPEALLEFLKEGWDESPPFVLCRSPHAERWAQRRANVSARFPGRVLIIPSGTPAVRNNDVHHRFRPSSNFVYLTGCTTPDALLVMVPEGDHKHRSILFVPASSRDDASFFTDRTRGALWVGPQLSVEEHEIYFGVDEAHPIDEFPDFMAPYLLPGHEHPILCRRSSSSIDDALPEKGHDFALAQAIAEHRLCKDDAEIKAIEEAITITRRGLEDVLFVLHKLENEQQIEGIFTMRARTEGNGLGYPVIAGAGWHACIPHWTRNDGELRPGELVLIDAGAENHDLYTADITRVFPISGRFSPIQRAVYDLVYEAQRAAIAAVKPGARISDAYDAAMRILTQGLLDFGILKGSLDEHLDPERQLYRRYTLHGISHMLGLDVHDCAACPLETVHDGRLLPHMVITIEPGLYFQPNDLTVPKIFRGIGIRIEDDVLVTETGARVLSSSIPADADAIEAWIAFARDSD